MPPEWQQHLFSARTHAYGDKGRVAEFNVLTQDIEGAYEFTKRIMGRNNRVSLRHAAFIQDCGDKLYIGFDGLIPDVLKESPYAYEMTTSLKSGETEKGRVISFVHGYFIEKGPKGRRIIPDLNEFKEAQKKHLGDILRLANEGEPPVTAETASFSKPRTRDTAWDTIASEFENRKYKKGEGVIFTPDGEISSRLEAMAQECASQGKLTRNKFLAGAAVVLGGTALIGGFAYSLKHGKPQNGAESRGH